MKYFLTGLVSLLVLISCDGKSDAPKVNTAVSTPVSGLLDAYLDVKDALVTSDPENVAKVETLFQSALDGVSWDSTQVENAASWVAFDSLLSAKTIEMTGATDIEQKRLVFSDISDVVYQVIKTYGNDGRPLFQQHCPMAFNDRGANWLSRQKMIANPYFGSKMLRCGTTTDTL